jgi:predicted transcriptional regulator
MTKRVLKVGIASLDQIKARTIAIARGEYRPAPDDPKVWFTSIESLAQVLSSKNKLLLELIARAEPVSMAELSELSGRSKGNLSRTLRTMRRYGLVEVSKGDRRRLIPRVPYERIELDMPLRAA